MVMGGDVGSAGGSEKPNGTRTGSTPDRFPMPGSPPAPRPSLMQPQRRGRAGLDNVRKPLPDIPAAASMREAPINASLRLCTGVGTARGPQPSIHPATSRRDSGASRRFLSRSMIQASRAANFAYPSLDKYVKPNGIARRSASSGVMFAVRESQTENTSRSRVTDPPLAFSSRARTS